MKIVFLFRPINLFIIAASMWLVRLCITMPILTEAGLQPYLTNFYFALLVASVVLIAAAGYVINDICDLEMDKINKPNKVFIDQVISSQSAIRLYYLLNTIGCALAVWVAFQNNVLKLASIQILTVGLLWIYATSLKKKLLVGNLTVAFLSALVFLLVAFYEPILFFNDDEKLSVQMVLCLTIITAFAAFSFVLSLARELVKDAEDAEGDRLAGSFTLPIVLGSKWLKGFVGILFITLIISFAWLQWHFYDSKALNNFQSLIVYLFLTIQLPLAAGFIALMRAKEKRHYTYLSKLLKALMLTGLIALFLLRYLL